MEKKEIELQIKEATLIFEDMLRNAYLNDKSGPKPLYGVHICQFMDFLRGSITTTRLKNGSIKISGCIPDDCIKKDVIGLPRKFDDYSIFPIVIGLFNEPEKEPHNKGKQ